MKVTVLTENSSAWSHSRSVLAEWGLSLYLEFDGKRVLFDAGHKGTFLQNAQHLGVDVNRSDVVVLSHHHWDHTGGLRFWEPADRKKLVAHPHVLPKMPKDESRSLAEKFEIVEAGEPAEFAPGMFFLGEIPRLTKFETGTFRDDPMTDDTAVAIKTAKGVVVVTGCSHAGVCNIVEYAKKVTGQRLYGVIGGFHLLEDTRPALAKTIDYFRKEQPDFLYPMHCVDYVAMSGFYQAVGAEKYGTGDSFEIKT